MLIANPLYDVIFKYLLEDAEIARALLSAILGEPVLEVSVQSQEVTAELTGRSLTLFRLDFRALVETADGQRRILIEMQKARHLLDLLRFRRYLAENYRQAEPVAVAGKSQALPIVTIYFLGFRLNIDRAVVHVNRQYRDGLSGEVITGKREEFLELLTHDSYAIQIPRLGAGQASALERILQVFRQEHLTDDEHLLDYRGELNDPVVSRMVSRLARAAAEEPLRQQMDLEDELERIYDRELRTKDEQLEAERQAKDEALTREETERKAKDEALTREQAERLAKDEALTREQAERRAKDEALTREQAERQAKQLLESRLQALARKLLADGLPVDEVAQLTGMTAGQIRSIASG